LTAKPLHEAHILLVITGGVAAYKALDLIRRLKERGADVHVVMTEAAKHFVTPLSVAALSGHPVRSDAFNLIDEAQMGHIELSRDADLVVVAPASADFIARMANGVASDLASTTLLATDKRALVAPAMNLRMWLHPATQRNVATLRADGVAFVGPEDGDMACGEYGPGRLAEPLTIVAAIERALKEPTAIPLPAGIGQRPQGDAGDAPASKVLLGKHVVVTSGPTYEPIDPVRFIGNRSSGLQGHAIARAAAAAGARVTLVSGPVALADPAGVETLHVETALQMRAAAVGALPADVFIAAAAVADWRVETAGAHKLKKGESGVPILNLVENPDILAEISAPGPVRPRIVVGFAAETENVTQNALKKLERKRCDLIVANGVGDGTGTFGGDANQVSIVSAAGVDAWQRMSKEDVARALVDLVARKLVEIP
jgi:phosphopantothenoylcysteine decarboxylase/phosphopantothenate--cysteine ligase